MQYAYSVFIEYMYNWTKPLPNFKNLSGLNGADICDITFTEGRGGGIMIIYDQGCARVWKS